MKLDFTTNGKVDVKKIQASLQYYLVDKSPVTLPDNIKEFLVKIAPYLAIISAIISLPILLTAVGLSLFTLPFAVMAHTGMGNVFDIIYAVVTFVLGIIMVPGLFARTKKVWNIMFYLGVANVCIYILTLNIGGLIIGSLISFYFLFQLRSLYKN